MSKLMLEFIEKLKFDIKNIIQNNLNYDINNINIEFPNDRNHGDLSCNVAMICAKILKNSPKKIAEIIINNFDYNKNIINKIEIAGAGFINFYLNNIFFDNILLEIKNLDLNYGKYNYGKNKKVLLEFVSANPTGPMHMGNARLGAFGDCLASILKVAGYDVTKEFYVNDSGNQIEKFGKSLDLRYQEIYFKNNNLNNNIIFPEDCYQGEDIKDLAQEFYDKYSDKYIKIDETERKKILIKFALPKNINKMKEDLKKYNIIFDNWFYESELYKKDLINNIINILNNKNLLYKKEEALWYKASEFGCEKDEVILRKNNTPTYFAADIAYHYDKFLTRKFDICINIWGADHHGHVARIKSAIKSLDINDDNLHILLVQLVKIIKNGEIVRMSKRTGKSIQLADLLDEVSPDAARFIFNTREINSKMDFDLDLAVKQDSQNPVYYVQYAHARICNIFKNLNENLLNNYNNNKINLSNLNNKEEKELIFYLSIFTHEIILAAKNYDPTRIIRYVINLSNLFHKFYNNNRVINNDDFNITNSRLFLCDCVKIVIKNILNLFKINTPEFM